MFRNTPRIEKNKILESSARNKFENEIWPEEKEKIINLAEKTIGESE